MSRLHTAARTGRYEEVGACLAQGTDVDAISVHHCSALMLAAREGHTDIVKLLLKAGANVHIEDPHKRTALHMAASGGRLETVQQLVRHGADVNALSGGITAALMAARFNHRDTVSFLRRQGTDMNVRDRQGLTADDWLALGGVHGRAKKEWPLGFPMSPKARQHAEDEVRRFMAEAPSAEEFAAKHGRRTLVWSYGAYQFEDADADRWAKRVFEILRSSELLDQCEEQFLQGEELEDARKCRARRARSAARQASRNR